MLKPGGMIGILGGGQLGRMMALAAAQLGYRCVGYAPVGDNVAATVCDNFFTNAWDDADALAVFERQCDVITWEFENVPVATARTFSADKIYPDPQALEVAQDRLNEKRFVEDLGGRPATYAAVDNAGDFATAIEEIGVPGILKTRREGYDGKGQWRVMEASQAWDIKLPDVPAIYEGFVDFEEEFSVILVRSRDGEVRFWDSPRNTHEGGILTTATLPAGELIEQEVENARELARQVANRLGYVGVLTLEFFATKDGPVFNEMAPRVHNSGHWTIEGAATSQFENHIRAVCGLPLGNTATIAPGIEMHNIIGESINTAIDWLEDADAHLHNYGKKHAREGRKMGHVTTIRRS